MQYYCTYFDGNYLLRGLALYESLRAHAQPFTLYALCLDNETFEFLNGKRLPRVVPISMSTLENKDPQLLDAKTNRSALEYYFTLTPCLVQYVFNTWPELELLTYLDSDLFFLHSPNPLLAELGDASIGIIEHRYGHEPQYWTDALGRFNVGWISFRNDQNTKACLAWWRERCLEGTPAQPENGRYGDQKYLDRWPELFQGVKILKHPGANLAYWNILSHTFSSKNRKLMVDEQPLIFYHCTGLASVGMSVYSNRADPRSPKDGELLARFIYRPYINRLFEIKERYQVTGDLSLSGLREERNTLQHLRTCWLFLRSGHYILRQLRNGSMFRLR